MSSSRCSTRSPFEAKRGSEPSSGRPIVGPNFAHCRSLPTPIAMSPSDVANVSYGTMLGWALPRRFGRGPGHERVLGLVHEHRERALQQRDVDPLASLLDAAASRAARGASSPASTDTAPNRPLTTSLIATPTFIGRPSGSPVIDIEPAHGLDHEVVARLVGIRPARAEAADREVDQPRVQLAEHLVGEAELREAADAEVLDDDVAARAGARAGRPDPRRVARSSRRLRLLRLTAR